MHVDSLNKTDAFNTHILYEHSNTQVTTERELLRTIVKAQQETISRLLALLEKAAKE